MNLGLSPRVDVFMKIGFLGLATNRFKGEDVAARACEAQANVEFAKLNAPDLLKVPVCVKKLFSEHYVDSVLAFIQASAGEDTDSLALVHEKVIDVEVSNGKLVFFCIVGDNEWSTEEQLAELAEKKIFETVQKIVETTHGIEAPTPPELGAAMGYVTGEASPTTPNGAEPLDFLEDTDVHKLF